ncbi:uncharacterized protein LOC122503635 [Leptopilina heterotoma]|uniref:uncharacterized protein LOC122503635 n=1 Tax=Leptopilina heterotoma TaxID=63436 RepID=UPI001CA8FBAD|nr:uncharacterized protein LOC122503635 [Leptopilina heterotoma]
MPARRSLSASEGRELERNHFQRSKKADRKQMWRTRAATRGRSGRSGASVHKPWPEFQSPIEEPDESTLMVRRALRRSEALNRVGTENLPAREMPTIREAVVRPEFVVDALIEVRRPEVEAVPEVIVLPEVEKVPRVEPKPSTSKGAIPKTVSVEVRRKKGESRESWESRRAVMELEAMISPSERTLEQLKQDQKKEIEYRNKKPLSAWDYVGGTKDKVVLPRSAELPREIPAQPRFMSTQQSVEEFKSEGVSQTSAWLGLIRPEETPKQEFGLPVIRAGRMFGGLDIIPTDPRVDPPPGVCHNCWCRGHGVNRCRAPRIEMCNNCGRREVVLMNCPRCSRVHKLDMRRKYGEDKYFAHRENRSRKYQNTGDVHKNDASSYQRSSVGSTSNDARNAIEAGSSVPNFQRDNDLVMETQSPSSREEEFPVLSFPLGNEFEMVLSQERDITSDQPALRVESHVSASERNILEELRELNVLLQGVPEELAQEVRAQFLKERTVRKSQL